MSLYRQGKVPGSFYDGYGQEAVSAGAAFAMAPEDRLCILHRDLAAHLIRGVSPVRILSQYMGRAGGVTRGRDGNVHFGDRALGCVGMVSMLPDMMLVATGMAMAFKLRNEARCAITWFGDGSTSRGDFHEAMNWAGVQQLPVIFVLENNQYAGRALRASLDRTARRRPAIRDRMNASQLQLPEGLSPDRAGRLDGPSAEPWIRRAIVLLADPARAMDQPAGHQDDRHDSEQHGSRVVARDHPGEVGAPESADERAGKRSEHRDDQQVGETRQQHGADRVRSVALERQAGDQHGVDHRQHRERGPLPRTSHPPPQTRPEHRLDHRQWQG